MDEPLKPTRLRATQLDAWPVVSSALFDFTAASDDIVSIVGFAGLNVDWNLNPKEAYSHSTRKRAYRPRVHAAYSELNPEDRETVLSLIIAELAHRLLPKVMTFWTKQNIRASHQAQQVWDELHFREVRLFQKR
jgi:hypothetical protein